MKIFKRSALILAVLAMACVLFALAVSAETYASDSAAVAGGAVARIGAEGSGTYYADFASAIGAARNGDTVTLLANTATAPVTVSADVTVTGNHTLTRASGYSAFLTVGSGANLTLDGVSVSSSTGSTILVSADASLTLKGAFSVDATGGGTVISVNAGSTVTVEGTGTVGSSGVEYALNVSGGTSDNPAVISIKGGEIRAHNPIVVRTSSTVTMDGGSLISVNGGSCLTLDTASHTVTINGGNLRQEGTANSNGINVKAATTAKITINDVNADLYGSCFLSDAVNTSAIELTINGGNFRSEKAYVITLGGGKKCKANILGGTFLGCTDTADGTVRVVGAGESSVMNIYGGYFRNGILFCARSEKGAVLNVYGGEFVYDPADDTNGGSPIRAGTTTAGGTANIYGGNFYTSTYSAAISANAGDGCTLNVYAATGNGGQCLALKSTGNGKNIAYPNGQDRITLNGIEMLAGASPRIEADGNGLRFFSTVPKKTINYLRDKADAGSISYGTLIIPADYLFDLRSFTIASLDLSGKPYVNIPAVDGITESDNGSVTICAALVRIKDANLGRNFVARSYIIYTVNGNTVVQYSDFHEIKNSRNLRSVAMDALDDVSSVKTDAYPFTVSEGVFSPYTAAQRETLTAYRGDKVRVPLDVYIIAGQSNGTGYTRWVEEFAAAYPQAANGYDNVYYSGNAASTGTVRINSVEDFSKAKLGFGKSYNYMGAEVGMADALSAYYNPTSGKEAAIVKYAVGGTNLADVLSGSNSPEGNWTSPSYLAKYGAKGDLSGGLYRNCIAQITDSLRNYRSLGYDVSVKAIFWMQGESDRNIADITDTYPEMLDLLIGDFRRDIGNLVGKDLSDLLFIIGETAEAFGCVHTKAQTDFVAMQDAYAASHDHVSVIRSGPMNTGTDGSDSAHWACDDMMLIGRMIGTEIINTLLGGSVGMPYLTGTPVAEVYNAGGALIGTYSHLGWAINTAPAGATVKLVSDVTLYGTLNLCNTKPVTVNGNGHNIISYAYGHGVNLVSTDITFVDFKVDLRRDGVDNAYALYPYDGAKAVFEGNCSFNAYKYGFVLNQPCTITIRGNTNITTRTGATNIQSAIHVEGQNVTLNIEGGKLTAVNNGDALYIHSNASGVVNISGGTFYTTPKSPYAIECTSTNVTINISGSPNIIPGASGTVTSKGSVNDRR